MNNNNNNCNNNNDIKFRNVFPVVIYLNLDINKKSIIKENKGKSGIYRWINKITGKSYIGGSINLGNRIKDYFNYSFLVLAKNKNMIIYKSILKYGYSNFKLEIIEYCLKKDVIIREQYYIDLVKLEYNILSKAGSSSGFKHSKESLLKLRTHLQILNSKKGFSVEIIDIKTQISTKYLSIRQAALAIKAHHKSLIDCDKNKKLLFKRYVIIIKR